MRLLLVEDDPMLASLILEGLGEDGLSVEHAENATLAQNMAELGSFDALILDVMLPEGDQAGFELARTLREARNRTPILFLTARADMDSKRHEHQASGHSWSGSGRSEHDLSGGWSRWRPVGTDGRDAERQTVQSAQEWAQSREPQGVDRPGHQARLNRPKSGSSLSAAQQTALLALIAERVGVLDEDDASAKMTEIKANLEKTYLAWYGPTTPGGAAYYCVTGPTVLIEYAPQTDRGGGGDVTNHAHNMYRDPTNDYGAAWTK